jgi:hypothetical protein
MDIGLKAAGKSAKIAIWTNVSSLRLSDVGARTDHATLTSTRYDLTVNIPPYLMICYAAVASCEMYFFLMQRSALEIGREQGIDARTTRHMLPLWYSTVYPVKIGKWVLLYLVYRSASWPPALVLWAIPLIIATVAPIPHRHFLPMFRRKVTSDISAASEGPAAKLMLALLSTSRG